MGNQIECKFYCEAKLYKKIVTLNFTKAIMNLEFSQKGFEMLRISGNLQPLHGSKMFPFWDLDCRKSQPHIHWATMQSEHLHWVSYLRHQLVHVQFLKRSHLHFGLLSTRANEEPINQFCCRICACTEWKNLRKLWEWNYDGSFEYRQHHHSLLKCPQV